MKIENSRWNLSNENGMKISLTEFGAMLLSVQVPNSSGKGEEITLSYDSLEQYENEACYFGI
jgi:aldose 1-epimerase